jgi:heat shock protein HslJ
MKGTQWLAAAATFMFLHACTPEEPAATVAPSVAPAAQETMKPDVPLTNTYWKLIELDGGKVQPGEGRELHMILRGADQVGGYAGCNQFTGSVTVTPDAISFGPIASTRRMCPDVMQQEGAYLQALENAHRYSISGEDLVIENASGVVTMRFVAVYMQ